MDVASNVLLRPDTHAGVRQVSENAEVLAMPAARAAARDPSVDSRNATMGVMSRGTVAAPPVDMSVGGRVHATLMSTVRALQPAGTKRKAGGEQCDDGNTNSGKDVMVCGPYFPNYEGENSKANQKSTHARHLASL